MRDDFLFEIEFDDPELREILETLKKPVLTIAEAIEMGPHGRTLTYEHVAAGLLVTFVSHGRRIVTALDFAKYILVLKRGGIASAPERSKVARERRLSAIARKRAPEVT